MHAQAGKRIVCVGRRILIISQVEKKKLEMERFAWEFLFSSREHAPEWLRDQYLEQYFEYQDFKDKVTTNYTVFHRRKTNADELLDYIW